MKCKTCYGKGGIFNADFDGMYDIVCPACKGKGEVDENGRPILTNEEWLCEQILHFTELSTEEKAKCLAEKIEYLSENLVEINVNKIAWLRWLKETHKE